MKKKTPVVFAFAFIVIVIGVLLYQSTRTSQNETSNETSNETNNDDLEAMETDGMFQEMENGIENDRQTLVVLEGPTIPLGDLEIGDRLYDPSWDWIFRAGDNHTNSSAAYNDAYIPEEQVKPVVWIIVGENHYDTAENESHFVLLSEEFLFRHQYSEGKNSWKDSMARDFLNTTFVGSFSSLFKDRVLLTKVPNWDTTYDFYHSEDYAWILSKDEYGAGNVASQPTGSVLAYFDLESKNGGPISEDELKERRMTTLMGDKSQAIRFPSRSTYYTNDESISQMENTTGETGSYGKIYKSSYPYRVAINLSIEGVSVSQKTNSDGYYCIVW